MFIVVVITTSSSGDLVVPRTHWRQGFLCRRTASIEQAADRAEAAAIDHYLSHRQLKTFFSSSLPRKTDDFFSDAPSVFSRGRDTNDSVTVAVTSKKTPQSTQKKTCTLFSAPDDLYKPAYSKSLSFSTGHSGLHRWLTAFTHSHVTLYGRSDKVCALLFAINLFHIFFAILTTDVVQS